MTFFRRDEEETGSRTWTSHRFLILLIHVLLDVRSSLSPQHWSLLLYTRCFPPFTNITHPQRSIPNLLLPSSPMHIRISIVPVCTLHSSQQISTLFSSKRAKMDAISSTSSSPTLLVPLLTILPYSISKNISYAHSTHWFSPEGDRC